MSQGVASQALGGWWCCDSHQEGLLGAPGVMGGESKEDMAVSWVRGDRGLN